MSVAPSLAVEIQKLDPSAVIELFELDTTDLGGGLFLFHNGTNELSQDIVWQGNTYIRFPIQVNGFETSGQGQFPRPVVLISNVMSAITTILVQYGDLLGAKFTRRRTLLKYLDAINFPGNVNPTEDISVFFTDDIFYVDRKSSEDRDQVQFELSSAADLQGVQVPKRVVIQSTCPWVYRGADCGYTGIPLYDENENELPNTGSAEVLTMRAAYQDISDAEVALAAAQLDLSQKADVLTAASVYTAVKNYNYSGPGAKFFIYNVPALGVTKAIWNSVEVPIGSAYGAGAFVTNGLKTDGIPYYGYFINLFEIIKYSRNETAFNTAQANYDAAVIARDSAQDDLVTAQNDFDAALAAVPANDPVFKLDRCGKRLSSCKIRFNTITPNSPLPFGGFPGVAR